MATAPNYLANLQKQLAPSNPPPINNGPYLDQAGVMPIQSVMSNDQFLGSLGPAWDEFSKPGGYLDKAYQGQTQIKNSQGGVMSIQDIANALKANGKDFTPNPFLSLPTLEDQLYRNVSGNVGGYYDRLQQALGAGRQDFNDRTAGYGQQLAGYFDQAGKDVADFGRSAQQSNQDFANSIGLSGTTGAGSQTSVLGDQLARLAALNATNKANAQATFTQRRGIIDDLLAQRALSAATTGADTQSAIAQMAAQHWGQQDPNVLFQEYLANQGQVGLAKSQMDLQLAQLQAQLAGGGGGSGGGGGRRRGGSGSSSGSAPTGSGPNGQQTPYDVYSQIFANGIPEQGIDPQSAAAYAAASSFERKFQGTDQTGRKGSVHKAVAV